MKVLAFLFLFTSSALAQETWELCLDQADFNFNADTFVKSVKLAKSGCVITFTDKSVKSSAKYQVNLCDPQIHVAKFESPQSEKYDRHYAGSTGCPAPLFGADFHVAQKGGVEFGEGKSKIMEIFAAVKKVYGPSMTVSDAAKIATAQSSDIKLACIQLLLEEYLNKCEAFTPKAK